MKLKNLLFTVLLYSNVIFSQSTPHQMVQQMGTGINLGNVLSAPFEGNWASALEESYVENVARLGFKHVRIPIRFDNQTTPFTAVTYTDGNGNYIGSPANYIVNVTYLNRIEQIIDWCLAKNLIAIIDVHGDHWFWESFDSSSSYYVTGNDRLARIDRFKAIWRDISIRFQNKSEKVLFEIMNEAYFSMSASEVMDINTQMLNIIRQTNPTRKVIVTGGGQNSYQAPLQMTATFLNSDNNLIATFHYYQPFSFTSSASEQHTDNDWGSTSDFNTVNNHFNQVQTWSLANNIPVLLGEFGADNVNGYNYFTNTSGNFGGPDVASRFIYHQYIANAARTRGFALSVWDAGEKAGKSIYLHSTKSWVKDVRNAVLNATCTNAILLNNADLECNYDYNWSLTTATNSQATLNNALPDDVYLGKASLNLNVQSSQNAFNNIIISNDEFTSGYDTNQTISFQTMAKGDNSQQFKMRVKSVVNGITTFNTSAPLTLSNSYSNYSFDYIVLPNTTSITFQLLCGEDTGNYYFDHFQVATTLNQDVFSDENHLNVYPNPVSEYFYISSKFPIETIEVYAIDGKKMDVFIENEKYYLKNASKGIYILKINSNSKTYLKKILIK